MYPSDNRFRFSCGIIGGSLLLLLVLPCFSSPVEKNIAGFTDGGPSPAYGDTVYFTSGSSPLVDGDAVHFTARNFLPASGDNVYFTDSGHAEFTSSVPLHTFTGVSSHLTGMVDPQENVVDFFLDLNTLRTGIDRRDRDMFRTLEVDEYPFAEFTGSLDTSFNVNSPEVQSVSVSGEFTVHGVTREKTVEGTLQKEGDNFLLEAEWILDITDYNIEPPGILFYRVRDEMDVRIEAKLEPVNRDQL